MEATFLKTSAVVGIGLARIGVPLGLTLVAMQLLKRRQIHEWSEVMAGISGDVAHQKPATKSELDALQRPCWEERGCTEEARQRCAASHNPTLPCWAALWVQSSRLPEGCSHCTRFSETRALRDILQ